ncbi:MAG TPA: DUF971 domain-containing protein [Limnobacter sp.]|nr:DUF971 domain-containing protein [Limnobacter sp.]
MNRAAVLPVAITDQRASQVLRIEWADGEVSELAHSMLRQRCRCAECVAGQRAGKPLAPGSAITAIELVGEHALNFHFADGHARGIFPWAYLRELGVAS